MECATQKDADPRRFVAIVGPTGSGKSDLALRICHELKGEIVNCDSVQLYRHFDIGSAKVPLNERQCVPHHLLDILAPDEVFTAGDYTRIARPLLRSIADRGALPVVVGGTGFYLRALIDGLFPGPGRDDSLRARLSEREFRRPGCLHRILRRLDPVSAESIHANDVPKTIRALEVRLLSGKPISDWFHESRDALQGFEIVRIGLSPDRDALYERLNQRLVRMFEHGLLDEVRHILDLGYSDSCKPFESLGYRQALQVVKGELTLRDAIYYAQRDTRNYAKRQWTWFRSDPGVAWFRGFGHDEKLQSEVVAYLQQLQC